MTPLDLTNAPPRSCYEELDGLMLMPRTIDKLRAMLPGGNAGGYVINAAEMKGISGYLLERLGIARDALSGAIAAARTEDDVAAWLRERTDAGQYPAINNTLRHLKPKHAENPDFFREVYAETIARRPELEYIVDIIDAEDRRIFPAAC